MSITDILDRLTLTRRLVTAVERMATAQEATNALLLRLVDHLAPAVPTPSEEDLRTAGPSFGRDAQHLALQEWLATFEDRVGRVPTEAEVEAWLDDYEQRPVA